MKTRWTVAAVAAVSLFSASAALSQDKMGGDKMMRHQMSMDKMMMGMSEDEKKMAMTAMMGMTDSQKMRVMKKMARMSADEKKAMIEKMAGASYPDKMKMVEAMLHGGGHMGRMHGDKMGSAMMHKTVYTCDECKMYYTPKQAKKMGMKDPMGHMLTKKSQAPAGYTMGGKKGAM